MENGSGSGQFRSSVVTCGHRVLIGSLSSHVGLPGTPRGISVRWGRRGRLDNIQNKGS